MPPAICCQHHDGRRDSTYRPALGRSANPSKPTNPTSWHRRAGHKTGPQPFSLARASTVGKPSKAYKPHQPARPAGLRVVPLLFSLARVSSGPPPANPTKPPRPQGTQKKSLGVSHLDRELSWAMAGVTRSKDERRLARPGTSLFVRWHGGKSCYPLASLAEARGAGRNAPRRACVDGMAAFGHTARR